MSDDFGTVSVRRAERTRELEVLRTHYREHHDALSKLADNAPTDFLATEYQRLISEIDAALRKLDELESNADSPRPKTQPGSRPIVHSPSLTDDPSGPRTYVSSAATPNTRSRILIMLLAGLIVLGLIGWLIWRAGGDRPRPAAPIVEKPGTEARNDTAAPSTIAPITPVPAATGTVPAAANVLKVTPALADYGTIRKGTRATRQFEIVNTSAAPITINVARSSCRCLYYEYADKLQPKKKETITVTIDGARAKAGTLAETIQVTAKTDPSISAQFQVQATIK
ncbi:MAG: DUF1573 domain-containing protein [Thermoanaerobaculia bacterium]